MTIVSDPSANAAEKIEHAAKILRASKQYREVFKAIYTGRKIFKTVEDIRCSVSNFNNNTYKAAAKLFGEDIVDRTRINNVIHYGKKDFYIHNRDKIINLSKDPERLKAYPTKRNPPAYTSTSVIKNYTFKSGPQAKLLTIDDIDSFKAVRAIPSADTAFLKKTAERKINRAICIILNQSEKKDWGGERNDLYTNNLILRGSRKPAAFAFKGKATKGILTLNKMGKKADQVQRLFEGTAEVYCIVYHGDIDERVLDQMQVQAIYKSVVTGKTIYYCPIDGKDLARLRAAYPAAFS